MGKCKICGREGPVEGPYHLCAECNLKTYKVLDKAQEGITLEELVNILREKA